MTCCSPRTRGILLLEDSEALQTALLQWYSENARDLPWRRTSDPYAIWVSEVMLQQTQVVTVIPYFLRFMELFPTVGDLASADAQLLAAAWSGLGYYTRMRQLHLAAQQVMEVHGGDIPSTWESFHALPGVGDYTAGAVLSMAYGKPYPAVDANAKRVLSRLLCVSEPIDKSATHARLRTAAHSLLPPRQAGRFNQAVMELGALVCTSRRPGCVDCPLSHWCLAHQAGLEQQLPTRSPRKQAKRVKRVAAALWRDERLLFVQRQEGPLAGFPELPAVELNEGETVADALERLVRSVASLGLSVTAGEDLGGAHHAFSHRIWDVQVYTLQWADGQVAEESQPIAGATLANNHTPSSSEAFSSPVWLSPTEAHQTGLPVAIRKVLDVALASSRTI
ncbi:MAG: A/G-specific adenine glycosylase [Limnochordia bacterium]